MNRFNDDHLVPADLADVNASLNALGRVDGQGLSSEAMGRMAEAAAVAATRTLVPAKPALSLRRDEAPIAIHQFRRVLGPIKIAAGVLLAVTAGLIILAGSRPGSDGTRLDPTQEVASMASTLALLDSGHDDLPGLSDDIDPTLGDLLPWPESVETGDM